MLQSKYFFKTHEYESAHNQTVIRAANDSL
jgi:hypothetical protein